METSKTERNGTSNNQADSETDNRKTNGKSFKSLTLQYVCYEFHLMPYVV